MKQGKWFIRVIGLSASFLTICGVSEALSSVPRYNIIDLGTLGGNESYADGINDLGQVVGESKNLDGVVCGFLWDNGVMTNMGIDYSGHRINNLGQVIGYGPDKNFIWENGTITIPGDGLVLDINDSGQVAGFKEYINQYGALDMHATLWQGNDIIDLALPGQYDFSYALAINNNGQIVGYSHEPEFHSFLWENGIMEPLSGDLGFATDINNLGQILFNGADFWDNGVKTELPLIWDKGAITYLSPGEVSALNNSGQAIGKSPDPGQKPLFWQDGISYELNNLIPEESRWVINWANDINDSGQIVGYGQINGQQHAFLMTPAPEPATILLLLSGGLIAIRCRKSPGKGNYKF